MRLVTYDLDGSRRLGAQADGVVMDLPEVVGHPAFPRTLEDLVARPRGSALEAARSALAQPAYLHDCDVPGARLLAPLRVEGHERVLGPDAELAWPGPADRLDCEPAVACVVGRGGSDLSPAEAREAIFGYTIMTAWWAIGPGGEDDRGPGRAGRPYAVSIGPCVATADEVDLRRSRLVARVDGEVWLESELRGAAAAFARAVARASAHGGLRPGELFDVPASGAPASPGGRGTPLGHRSARRGGRRGRTPSSPEVVVEIEVGGIGTLRTLVSAASRVAPLAPSATGAGRSPGPGRAPAGGPGRHAATARRGFTTPR